MLTSSLSGQDPELIARLARVPANPGGEMPWELELMGAVAAARSHEEARACANEVLIDADARLGWGAHVPVGCARIALFGAMFAAVLLLMREPRLTLQVLDVVAIGASGALISMFLGKEASRRARERRKQVDTLVDRLMRLRGYALPNAGQGARRPAGGEPE